MRRILTAMVMAAFTSCLCLGQRVKGDPNVRTYAIPDSVDGKETVSSVVAPLPLNGLFSNELFTTADSLSRLEIGRNLNSAITPKSFDQSGTAFIPLWRNGGFLATDERTVMPGLMRIDSGRIGLVQNLEHFSLYIGGMANKYGYYNGKKVSADNETSGSGTAGSAILK